MANGKVGRPAGVRRKALTAREQKFAQVYARTCNKSAAFREAYSCGQMNATQIAQNANRIYNRQPVQDEIARLQAAEEQARSDAYAQQCAAELNEWSRADSIDHLKQVIDAAREAMRVPLKNDDGDVIGYDFDPAAARVIRDTVETLNKMQGYNEPEKSEVDARVSVEFADGDDLSV